MERESITDDSKVFCLKIMANDDRLWFCFPYFLLFLSLFVLSIDEERRREVIKVHFLSNFDSFIPFNPFIYGVNDLVCFTLPVFH